MGRSARVAPFLGLGLAAVLIAAAYLLADGYAARLDAPGGFARAGPPAPPGDAVADAPRPRRTVVVLVDGLRADAALRLAATRRLAAAGQCHPTDVGQPSISRAVYASLSSGVEQDRSGVRNNDFRGPAPVESLWEVARAAGLRVAARSELPWFRELFPRGFDDYRVVRRPLARALDDTRTADLLLLHPLDVDEAGHEHGAASPEYAAAVAGVDRELGVLLDGLDLARDLVVLTADHGHTDRGGHGGAAPEVRWVVTCLAGPGVVPGAGGAALRTTDLAPALAVLLGLPFPRHMRPPDALAEIVDPGPRRAELDRRAAAFASVAAAAAAARAGQALRLALVGGLIGALLGLGGPRRSLQVLLVIGVTLAAHRLALGPLDLSAVNRRSLYVPRAALICLGPALLGALAFRSLSGQALVALVALVAIAGHPIVFGLRPGVPLPPPLFLYLPYPAAFFGVVHAGLLALAVLLRLARDRASVQRPSDPRGRVPAGGGSSQP